MAQQNTVTLESIKKDAEELGELAGKGKNVQSQFALKLIEGGYHGVLDTAKDKHGKGVDDAQYVSEIYVKAQDKNTIFDAKAGNTQKLMSCARKLIEFGGVTKFGTNEPLNITNQCMSLWSKERQKPSSRGKLDDAFNTLMKLARECIKADQLPAQSDLIQFVLKPQHAVRSAERIIAHIRKEATNLFNGKASQGTVQDNSAEVKAIITACNVLIDKYAAKNKKPAKAAASKAA